MFVAGSVVCLTGLLAADVSLPLPLHVSPSAVSAFALLLIGVSFLMAQAILRPRPAELLKNVLLAAAFLLWGAVQLMEQNALSKKLGDVVIALYVVDLAWMIFSTVKPAGAAGDD